MKAPQSFSLGDSQPDIPEAIHASTRHLVERLAEKSEGGWAELLQRAESKLRILLSFRMSPRARAACSPEDLLQEVWIEAARKIDGFEYRGQGSLQRWLAQITRNKLLHAERGGARLATSESNLNSPHGSETQAPSLLGSIIDPAARASVQAQLRETEEQMREVLRSLSEPEREVIMLRHFEGLNGIEAAKRLDVDPSTVSSRYKRALETCARRLDVAAP